VVALSHSCFVPDSRLAGPAGRSGAQQLTQAGVTLA
jgi:hypothetical protein